MLVVAADAGDGGGQLGEAVAPRPQTVAEDAKRVAGAAQGVTAMVLAMVGMVVDGIEEPGGAGSGVPPGPQQGPGAPERDPGYPPAV